MLVVVALPQQTAPLAAFVPADFLAGSVWQVVTYPFFVAPSIFLLVGMYFFYRFGGLVENALDRGRYVRLLLAVTLTPPVVVVLAHLLTVPGFLVGSHLPHLAVFVAAVTMMPNAPTMLLGFAIKWLAVAFVVIALLLYLMMRNLGGCIALVSVTYLAIWWMKQAGHVSQWGVVDDVLGPKSQRKSRKKKSPSKKKRTYEKKLKPRTKISSSKRKDIDRILDKINEEGLHSLTEEERKVLQQESKR